jgi:hypothetical protein
MHTPDAADTIAFPTPGAVGPNPGNYFAVGSVIDRDVVNVLVKELIEVLNAASVTPVKATTNQVATAIATLIDNAKQHALDSTTYHTSSVTTGNLMEGDADGLPTDSGIASSSVKTTDAALAYCEIDIGDIQASGSGSYSVDSPSSNVTSCSWTGNAGARKIVTGKQ